MRKIWLLVLAFIMSVSSVCVLASDADLNDEPVIMTITAAQNTSLENGTVTLSGNWGVSTPTTEDEKNSYGSPKGDPTIYSGGENSSASFKPDSGVLKAGFYKVDYYKILYAGSYSRPVVKFEIFHNGKLDTESFNFNEAATKNVKEYIDLGTYYFSGDGTEYVKVVNTTQDCVLRTSAVKFTLSEATEEIAADRGGILVTGAPFGNSCWSNTIGHAKCVTAKGEQNVFSTNAANAFAGYTADIAEEGYYDVYIYKIRYIADSAAKLNTYIIHDGRQDSAEVDFSDMKGDSSVWQYLGRYFFSGNAKNEYISFENTVSGQWARVGGVKLVKSDIPCEGYEETIVRATDRANTNANGFSWALSSAVTADDGSATLYSTTPGARFTFKANTLTEGTYKVYYWRAPYISGNDDNLWMTVSHNGKTDAALFDYSAGEKEWVCIGEYDFAGGSENENVTLLRIQSHTKTNVSTRATAVRFVKNAPAEEEDTYVIAPSFTNGANVEVSGVSESNRTTAEGYVIRGVFPYAAYASGSYIKYCLPTSGAKPGKYDVYMTIFTSSRGNNPKVTVLHNNETETPDIDITAINPDEDGLYKIGTYYFTGNGRDEYVSLSNRAGALTRFGAVKFVYKGGDAVVPDGRLSAKVLYSDGAESISKAILPDKTTIALRASVKNGTDAVVYDVPTVFAGVYRKDRLVEVTMLLTEVKSIESGRTAYYTGNIPATLYESGDVVKAFVLQDNLKPVDTIDVLNITE